MFGPTGFVAISSGKSNGRSVYDQLIKGSIRISGVNADGVQYERILFFDEGQIQDNRLRIRGKTVHHVIYGWWERKLTEHGVEVTRFRKGANKGKDGKSRRFITLFGKKGVCHSWYKRGRLVRQKFIFLDSKRLAYDWKPGKLTVVRDHAGKELYRLIGAIDGREQWRGDSLFDRPMEQWFLQSMPFQVFRKGKLLYSGQWANRQQTGVWFEKGREVFYEHGVPIPRDLYETPPEKLDVRQILKEPNAQVRMALMSRIKPEQIASAGKIIHSQGKMKLYKVRGWETNILRVQCPTTKSFYYLSVPGDSTHCEEARQWTFHVGDGIPKPIRFALET